jgi:Na+/phosphate symporter
MTDQTVALLLPMFEDAIELLSLTRTCFHRYEPGHADTAMVLGRSLHKRERELTEQLVAASSDADGLRFVPSHLERISDAAQGLLRCVRTMQSETTVFTEGGVKEVDQLFDRATEMLVCARDLTLTKNRVLARHVEIESLRFHDLASGFARAHEGRLLAGVCTPAASSAYLSMLDYLREVTRHARRIAARVLPQEAAGAPGRRAP